MTGTAGSTRSSGLPTVVIVGRPNVGKSTLFNRLIGEDRSITHDMPGTTRDTVDTVVDTGQGPIRFLDTAGMRRKARIDEDACIKCGRCFAACEDTSHQAIAMSEDRVFTVIDEECVACNLCVNVCPVEGCITMEELKPGAVDLRTGKEVAAKHGDWTTHPNNPGAVAAE